MAKGMGMPEVPNESGKRTKTPLLTSMYFTWTLLVNFVNGGW